MRNLDILQLDFRAELEPISQGINNLSLQLRTAPWG